MCTQITYTHTHTHARDSQHSNTNTRTQSFHTHTYIYICICCTPHHTCMPPYIAIGIIHAPHGHGQVKGANGTDVGQLLVVVGRGDGGKLNRDVCRQDPKVGLGNAQAGEIHAGIEAVEDGQDILQAVVAFHFRVDAAVGSAVDIAEVERSTGGIVEGQADNGANHMRHGARIHTVVVLAGFAVKGAQAEVADEIGADTLVHCGAHANGDWRSCRWRGERRACRCAANNGWWGPCCCCRRASASGRCCCLQASHCARGCKKHCHHHHHHHHPHDDEMRGRCSLRRHVRFSVLFVVAGQVCF